MGNVALDVAIGASRLRGPRRVDLPDPAGVGVETGENDIDPGRLEGGRNMNAIADADGLGARPATRWPARDAHDRADPPVVGPLAAVRISHGDTELARIEVCLGGLSLQCAERQRDALGSNGRSEPQNSEREITLRPKFGVQAGIYQLPFVTMPLSRQFPRGA